MYSIGNMLSLETVKLGGIRSENETQTNAKAAYQVKGLYYRLRPRNFQQ